MFHLYSAHIPFIFHADSTHLPYNIRDIFNACSPHIPYIIHTPNNFHKYSAHVSYIFHTCAMHLPYLFLTSFIIWNTYCIHILYIMRTYSLHIQYIFHTYSKHMTLSTQRLKSRFGTKPKLMRFWNLVTYSKPNNLCDSIEFRSKTIFIVWFWKGFELGWFHVGFKTW